MDLLGKKEVFVSVFSYIGHLSTINDRIQAGLNSVVEIIGSFAFLEAGLDVMCKLLTEGALARLVWEVGVDGCKFGNIPFLWSVLVSGSNCCRTVVPWSGLWC